MLNIRPFASFDDAAQAVLGHLQRRIGFELWLLARRTADGWQILHSRDSGYDIQDMRVLQRVVADCARLVLGRNARVTVDAGKQQPDLPVPAAAWMVVPLRNADGDLFGLLCALNPRPVPEVVTSELKLVDLLGRTLATLLQAELRAEAERQRADSAEIDAMIDPLTGLYNRRAWDHMLSVEEARCRRYGHGACICVVDLDELKRVNDFQGHAAGD